MCALQFAMLVTQRFKHALACPRPAEYDPTLQPIVLTPPYGAFPGGHAVEAVMVARLFAALGNQVMSVGLHPHNDWLEQFEALTIRITENRVVAGLHFAVDGASGYVLGEFLAAYFLARCGQTAGDNGMIDIGWSVDGNSFKAEDDFVDGLALRGSAFAPAPKGQLTVTPSPFMEELWKRARAEWRDMGF